MHLICEIFSHSQSFLIGPLSPSPCSMLIGNSFVFFQFQGKDSIDADTRHIVFTVLISVAIVGVVFFCVLRRVHNTFEETGRDRELDYESSSNSIIGAFVKAIKLLGTRDMLLLSITFLYTGKYKMQMHVDTFLEYSILNLFLKIHFLSSLLLFLSILSSHFYLSHFQFLLFENCRL